MCFVIQKYNSLVHLRETRQNFQFLNVNYFIFSTYDMQDFLFPIQNILVLFDLQHYSCNIQFSIFHFWMIQKQAQDDNNKLVSLCKWLLDDDGHINTKKKERKIEGKNIPLNKLLQLHEWFYHIHSSMHNCVKEIHQAQ